MLSQIQKLRFVYKNSVVGYKDCFRVYKKEETNLLVKLPNLPYAVDTPVILPTGLAQCLAENFGSFDNFKKKFTDTAAAGNGSG